jgi:hypothetical protein
VCAHRDHVSANLLGFVQHGLGDAAMPHHGGREMPLPVQAPSDAIEIARGFAQDLSMRGAVGRIRNDAHEM